MTQLTYQSPHRTPHPDTIPKWDAVIELEKEPEPAEIPEDWKAAAPHPPFDLAPHEVPPPGEPFDIPRILAGRVEKRLRRAEARREGRRRKLERLRA